MIQILLLENIMSHSGPAPIPYHIDTPLTESQKQFAFMVYKEALKKGKKNIMYLIVGEPQLLPVPKILPDIDEHALNVRNKIDLLVHLFLSYYDRMGSILYEINNVVQSDPVLLRQYNALGVSLRKAVWEVEGPMDMGRGNDPDFLEALQNININPLRQAIKSLKDTVTPMQVQPAVPKKMAPKANKRSLIPEDSKEEPILQLKPEDKSLALMLYHKALVENNESIQYVIKNNVQWELPKVLPPIEACEPADEAIIYSTLLLSHYKKMRTRLQDTYDLPKVISDKSLMQERDTLADKFCQEEKRIAVLDLSCVSRFFKELKDIDFRRLPGRLSIWEAKAYSSAIQKKIIDKQNNAKPVSRRKAATLAPKPENRSLPAAQIPSQAPVKKTATAEPEAHSSAVMKISSPDSVKANVAITELEAHSASSSQIPAKVVAAMPEPENHTPAAAKAAAVIPKHEASHALVDKSKNKGKNRRRGNNKEPVVKGNTTQPLSQSKLNDAPASKSLTIQRQSSSQGSWAAIVQAAEKPRSLSSSVLAAEPSVLLPPKVISRTAPSVSPPPKVVPMASPRELSFAAELEAITKKFSEELALTQEALAKQKKEFASEQEKNRMEFARIQKTLDSQSQNFDALTLRVSDMQALLAQQGLALKTSENEQQATFASQTVAAARLNNLEAKLNAQNSQEALRNSVLAPQVPGVFLAPRAGVSVYVDQYTGAPMFFNPLSGVYEPAPQLIPAESVIPLARVQNFRFN